MLYCHAKHGGPVALTSHPDQFIMANENNSLAIKNICIFRNDGELMHKISKEGLQKIVGMDFLDEEYLIVIMADGTYLMVDPHKGIQREYHLG
mmetsp:Transcript_31952/g.28959  ORF Transcript_31952/g.28959 Transcript_31952/m.28959 type:complete len:93 (-) Transcript_31952:867-1145(-)